VTSPWKKQEPQVLMPAPAKKGRTKAITPEVIAELRNGLAKVVTQS